MTWTWGFALILLSIIAVPSLLLSQKPNDEKLLVKVEPYQVWIGLMFCFWGIWGIILTILNIKSLITNPIWFITLFGGTIFSTILGYTLGFSLINKMIKPKNRIEKIEASELRYELAPIQGKLGVIGLILGTWMIMASFLFI